MPEPIKTSLSQPQPAGTGTSTSTSTLTNSSNGKRASANGQQPAASRYLPREVPPRFRQQEQKQLLKRGQPLPAGALSAPGPAPATAAAAASPPPPPQQGAAGQQHPGKAQPGKGGARVGLCLLHPLSRLFSQFCVSQPCLSQFRVSQPHFFPVPCLPTPFPNSVSCNPGFPNSMFPNPSFPNSMSLPNPVFPSSVFPKPCLPNSILKFQSSNPYYYSYSGTMCRFWHPLVKDFIVCSLAQSCEVFL